jgi:hypothetical protein
MESHLCVCVESQETAVKKVFRVTWEVKANGDGSLDKLLRCSDAGCFIGSCKLKHHCGTRVGEIRAPIQLHGFRRPEVTEMIESDLAFV